MKSWLHRMLAEIDAVTDEQANSVSPRNERCRHTHVVGELTPELKKIRFLYQQYRRRERELEVAFEFSSKAERVALIEERRRFQTQAETLENIFWVSCREAFPELWDKSLIGISAGCEVVWSEHGDTADDIAAVILTVEELIRAGFPVH